MHTQFRSVVASLLAVSLALPALGAPVPRRRPAQTGQAQPAANAPGCEGLTSAAGSFAANNQKRIKLNENFCEKENLSKAVEDVRKRLEACKEAGTYVGRYDHVTKQVVASEDYKINPDVFYPDLRKRANEACAMHKHYTRTAKDLCTEYGKEGKQIVDEANAARAATMNDGPGETPKSQLGYFNSVVTTAARAGQKYRYFERTMKGLHANLEKQLPGLDSSRPADQSDPVSNPGAVGKDKIFEQAISRVRYQINSLATQMRQQASTAGDARTNAAGAAGANSTLRFRNNDDMRKFWTALTKCEALVKPAGQRQQGQNGALDRLNTVYQATLAKSLGDAKIESADLAAKFGTTAQEYEQNAAAASASARKLSDASSENPTIRARGERELAGAKPEELHPMVPRSPNQEASIRGGEQALQRGGSNGPYSNADELLAGYKAGYNGSVGRKIQEDPPVAMPDGTVYRVFRIPQANMAQPFRVLYIKK